MNVLDFLKGKHIMVLTDVGVTVELEIDKVVRHQNSRDLEKATKENDWYPASTQWSTYTVHFTNGHCKTYDTIEDINVFYGNKMEKISPPPPPPPRILREGEQE